MAEFYPGTRLNMDDVEKTQSSLQKAVVVGASGATGRLLVADLLGRGVEVRAIVRASSSMADTFGSNPDYQEVPADISTIPDDELRPVVSGCDAVFSCLGHNLTFRGLFGKPRRLVTDAIEKICRVIESITPQEKIKIVLMNSTGNSNRDIPERPPLSQRFVIFLLRYLLPPHADNERAADFLRVQIGRSHRYIEWVAVRPDGLIDDTQISAYEIEPSPTRNVIFDAGKVSRINVAHFMASLAADSQLWNTWRGRMPVISNASA